MNPTKHQHYIPSMILKRHASVKLSKARKSHIWTYNTNTKVEKECIIKDVCLQDYLYELYDENGNILGSTLNYIEDKLSKIETKTSVIFDKLSNSETITETELCYVYVFSTLQILRIPNVLSFTKEYLHSVDSSLSSNLIDNISKVFCLDFSIEHSIFTEVVKLLANYIIYMFLKLQVHWYYQRIGLYFFIDRLVKAT